MTQKEQAAIIKKIIKLYGPVIDLRSDPEVMIDILLTYRHLFDRPDGATTEEPGNPPTTTTPGVGGISLADLMSGILRLSRAVNELSRDLRAVKSAVGTRARKK